MYSTHRSNGREVDLTAGPGDRTEARRQDRRSLCDVDVAIVMESTYPYLKGGVSAVVHDIVVGNPDLTFGIIHITWDRDSPHEDLYGVPENVRWVEPVYLSMQEHREDFMRMSPQALRMRASGRRRLAHRLYDALEALARKGDPTPLWELYDVGANPLTQEFPIWGLLGTREFMEATRDRLPGLGLPLTDTFWLMREFFSLAYALLSVEFPKARVYHAHTTGYASLLGAAAARQHGTGFLLTEHNLYVRDTVNTLLERSMALPLTRNDYRTFDVTPTQRAWMAWWTEMGRFCYPSAQTITYLYPRAITEAADLGAPVERSVVVPNGMVVEQFADVAAVRAARTAEILTADTGRTWRFASIARVVPIKGVHDLIDSVAALVERGVTNLVVDVLGPTDHVPAYYEACKAKVEALGLTEHVVFRGVVKVRELLEDYDALVLSSYNEGQPIVVLEAMTAGIPTVGTEVGGMAQLIDDPLTTTAGRTWDACGLLVTPGDVLEMADGIERLMGDPELYERLARNARGRVEAFFQLADANDAYNALYREAGGLPPREPASVREQVLDVVQAGVPAPRVSTGPRVIDLRDVVLEALDGEDAAGRDVEPEVV
ncbi:GT4 family glycosyltransferase PelF [Kineococcus rhizosphaerae]|uniref:Glycosyltransferase involved in cell wall biosynthesis n=1 Tax=Kineococcus rhizosphaerae TaxID=559628 RepID=A0A2T0R896_9ACTN|nr:GT4 family glycosyltransferase PelF [Kineococcus rhizosphaerae]PRY17391.1 hypothetical protein CLV37_102354 [Kineococcus rhizosphaerae]